MTIPDQLLLSDLLRHRVRCDQGIDHGQGVIAWMHPPVHRLLGWATKPSALRIARDVWRLDQLRGLRDPEVFVKGNPTISDQVTLDRIPTLLDADLVNIQGEKLGVLADLVFSPKTGTIIHYLVSRSDPRIPGTSRWRLTIDRIKDQQPGIVSSKILSIDELPLVRSSVRQDLLRKSRVWREQFQEFSSEASQRLEGWLEEPPWEEKLEDEPEYIKTSKIDPLEDWSDEETDDSSDFLESKRDLGNRRRSSHNLDGEEDPWI